MSENRPLPLELQVWVEVRIRHRLSHAHVQMARELGMNPTKLGKIDNHRQEPWKMPLRHFIEHLYMKHFGRRRPDRVLSVEERARELRHKKEQRTLRKLERRRVRAPEEARVAGAEAQVRAQRRDTDSTGLAEVSGEIQLHAPPTPFTGGADVA